MWRQRRAGRRELDQSRYRFRSASGLLYPSSSEALWLGLGVDRVAAGEDEASRSELEHISIWVDERRCWRVVWQKNDGRAGGVLTKFTKMAEKCLGNL